VVTKLADAATLADTLTMTLANQYGLLAAAATLSNVDAAGSTGFYYVPATASGTKPSGYTTGTLSVCNNGTAAGVTQVFTGLDGADTGMQFVRRFVSGAWGAWHSIVTLDNTGSNFVRTLNGNAPSSAGDFVIPSQRNKLANAEFKRFSKGNPAAGALSNVFVCDHWWMSSAGATVTQGSNGVTSTPNFLNWQETSGTGTPTLNQNIEDVRTLQGGPVSVSILINPSKNMTLQPNLIQKFGTGGSANVTTAMSTASVLLASGWTRYICTATLPSVSGKTFGTDAHLCLQLGFGATPGTFTCGFTEAQLEYGPYMGFDRLRPSEYDAFCLRYFQRLYHASGILGWTGNLGNTQTGGNTESFFPKYKVPTPTATVITSTNFAAGGPTVNATTQTNMRWTTPQCNLLLGGQASIYFNIDLDAEIPVL